MKKIILAAINARYTHMNPALYYLKEYVKDLDYEIKIIEFDLTFDYGRIMEEIAIENPDAVCFSVYIWNTEVIKTVIIGIKTYLPETKVILGGPEVSYDPEEWLLKFKNIDYIICGYGEAGFRYLLQYDVNPLKKIIRINNPPFDSIPFPYGDLSGFKNKYIYYESSRGCAFACIYCLSSVCGGRVEYRGMDSVENELGILLKSKCNCVKFIDRSFNINKNHSRRIWKFLIENHNDKIKFHFEIHPQFIDDEDLSILKNAPENYFRFEIGVQSTNNDTLKEIKRNGDWNIMRENIKRISNLKNIHIHLDLIAGLPGEDYSKIKKSFNEVYCLKPDHLQFGFLKILKGTEISSRIDQYEIRHNDNPPYIILKNKWLGFEELRMLHMIENALDAFFNTGKFKVTIRALENNFGEPFNLYEALVNHAAKINKIRFTKDWNGNALFLLDYVKENFTDRFDYFKDCIKYDFCSLGNFNHYPDFLKDENLIKIKRKIVGYFNQLEKDGKIIYNGEELKTGEINRAAYFIPQSDDFKAKYLSGNDYALFITKNKIIHVKL